MIKKIIFLFSVTLIVAACSKPANKIMSDYSVAINAPVEQVWAAVGNFATLHEWHPAVANTVVSEDGKTRTLTLADGATIMEELVSQADDRYTYKILQGPLPVEGYQSTISIKATDDGNSKVTWSSSYSPKKGTTEDAAKKVIDGIYTTGLDSLASRF